MIKDEGTTGGDPVLSRLRASVWDARGPDDALTVAIESIRGELQQRLQSRASGGRPSDPNWQVSRLLPMSEETWNTLQRLGQLMSTPARRVSAMQVAALFVEHALLR